MSLLQKIVDQVSLEVRQRGVKCRGKGQVKILDHTDAALHALVGCGADEPCAVDIARGPATLEYGCDCDTFADSGEPCEHLWAALLTADAMGLLASWKMPGAVRLVPMEDEKDSDTDDAADLDFMERRAEMDAPDSPLGRLLKSTGLRKSNKPAAAVSDWKAGFDVLRSAMTHETAPRDVWPDTRQILYVIDAAETLRGGGLTIELMTQDRKKDGEWTKARHQSLSSDDADRLPDRDDAVIVATLGGAARDSYGYYYAEGGRSSRYRLQDAQYSTLLPHMCNTGRCRLRQRPNSEFLSPLAWDSTVWEFWLTARRDAGANRFVISGELRAGEQRMALDVPVAMLSGGVVFTETHAAVLDHNNAFAWIVLLRKQGDINVPTAEGDELLGRLLTMPELPRLDLPEELQAERVEVTPKPRLRVKKPSGRNSYYSKPRLLGELSFDYEGHVVAYTELGMGIYQSDRKRLVMRDRKFEREALGRLRTLGFRDPRASYYARDEDEDTGALELAPSHLPAVIRTLLSDNWFVEADGQLYRQPGEFKMEVSSGIDWFELHGSIDFDGQVIGLPELLRALRRGERTVRLDDGTFGVLPEAWMQKYGLLAGVGEEKEDHVRFGKAQVGLLDAMLMAQPQVSVDAVFEAARQRLRKFEGVRAADPPASFVGVLRPYQREGLGWLEFLREFGFGGCLADDMGLGKTVQVLALLEERRLLRAAQHSASNGDGTHANGDGAASSKSDASLSGADSPRTIPSTRGSVPPVDSDEPTDRANANGKGNTLARRQTTAQDKTAAADQYGPSLVVAPRSLVFNWQEEATRFAPGLRVLDHTGIGRRRDPAIFKDYDLILTTYGTLRNDITFFKDVRFDYVVLDEAQAVKNASSESAKAARLLGGNHRLALSGTPVQNHLGELWSLFEFLNPGMLGTAKAFAASGAGSRTVDESARVLLSRALRPLILRRTKAQVARDLPQRLEQTIHCELDAVQRKMYNDLKDHYRQSLLQKIAVEGIAKNKIQVLEALLRLRQAACHPGLIDKSKTGQGSAKLDALLPQLAEVTDGGHKALVFSQFTSMLAIVRDRLDTAKVPYAYLDGRTRDRQAVVERFQKEGECKLFLISLKAGGVGLNLTAAEYVFLLDPWWNPAVEAQAIDRAHRIGQTRQVFAYRIIAKDTVEEKVLQLQSTKRELADAIINADNSLIGKLGRDDLEVLLS